MQQMLSLWTDVSCNALSQPTFQQLLFHRVEVSDDVFYWVASWLMGILWGNILQKLQAVKKKMSMILNLQSPQSRNYVENVP